MFEQSLLEKSADNLNKWLHCENDSTAVLVSKGLSEDVHAWGKIEWNRTEEQNIIE